MRAPQAPGPKLAGAAGLVRHELKTWPAYFDAVWSKQKRFEIRKNDRNYQVGDELVLREYDPEIDRYSGREVVARVTYRLPGGRLGIDPDYCVMSLKLLAYRCRKSPNAQADPRREGGCSVNPDAPAPLAPAAGSAWVDCPRHGWSACGIACPYCVAGDSPRHCSKHGWSHSTQGCPTCRLSPPNAKVSDRADNAHAPAERTQ